MSEFALLFPVTVFLILSAISVVTTRNLVHSVFWLASTLITTAAVYVFLGATFIAAIQLLLYTGGVITLMLFGIMLSRRHSSTTVPNPSEHQLLGAVTAGGVLVLFLTAIWRTPAFGRVVDVGTSLDVGNLFLSEHLLAFEALSVLLLAAMLGAIVLTRTSDP
ncbi:MAG: NADH-quinone oxidoreductase subunit J [Deltaproteobacteria bacterium]|nr:NADH-quinone oxidoreductase subunit J [Deltaproteobacteria bacterium]